VPAPSQNVPVKLARPVVLLALALLVPRVEASVPRTSSSELTTDAAPSLSIDRAIAAAGTSAFSLGLDQLAEVARVQAFHPLAAVSLLNEDDPTPDLASELELREPETRIGGSGLFLGTRIGGKPRLTLDLRWGCDRFGCELVSGNPQDPMGLQTASSDEDNWAWFSDLDRRLRAEKQGQDVIPLAASSQDPVARTPSLWDKVLGLKKRIQEAAREFWRPAVSPPGTESVEVGAAEIAQGRAEAAYDIMGDIYAVGAGVAVEAGEWQIGGKLIKGVVTVGGRVLRITSALGPSARGGLQLTKPLSRIETDVLRAEARDIWQAQAGKRAFNMGLEVHHRVPLEWAHVVRGDPNRLENLVGVPEGVHERITASWAAWKKALGNRVPSASEVLAKAEAIDKGFAGALRPLKDL